MRPAWLLPLLLLLAWRGAAAATDPCALADRSTLEALTNARVVGTRIVDTELERICIVSLLAGETPGRIRLAIFKQTPATLETGMTLQPLDKLLPVSEVGDEAVINTNANELKFRVGTAWFDLKTQAAPCHGDPLHDDDSARIACSALRNEMLSTLAHTVARSMSATRTAAVP